MSKQRIDLNRYKKIYPLKRKSPQNFNKTQEAYGATITFAAAYTADIVVENSGTISSTPVATIASTDSVNVWISSIARSIPTDATSDWKVTVISSSAFTGEVYVLLVEAS